MLGLIGSKSELPNFFPILHPCLRKLRSIFGRSNQSPIDHQLRVMNQLPGCLVRVELCSFLSAFKRHLSELHTHMMFSSVKCCHDFSFEQQQRISAVRFYYMSNGNAAEAGRLLSEDFLDYKMSNVTKSMTVCSLMIVGCSL